MQTVLLCKIKPLFSSHEDELTPIQLPFQDETIIGSGYIDDVTEENLLINKGVQHIGFKLFTEEFLLPMVMVREIIMLTTITFVPKSPFLLEGIIALRGEIMPVLNLRRFLKFSRGKAESTTRIIILQCEKGGFGILVDDITEFVRLQPSEVESIPQNFFPPEYKILSGVSRVGNRIRGIIDMDKLVIEFTTHLQKDSVVAHESQTFNNE